MSNVSDYPVLPEYPVDLSKSRRSALDQALDSFGSRPFGRSADEIQAFYDSADPEFVAQNAFVSRNNALARADMTRRIDKVRSDAQRQLDGNLSWYEKGLLYNPLIQNTIGNPVYNPLTHNMEYEGSNGLLDGLLGGLYNFGKAFVSGVKGDPDWGRRQDEAVVSKVRDKYKFWDDYQQDVLSGKAPEPKAPPGVKFSEELFSSLLAAAVKNPYDLTPDESLLLDRWKVDTHTALEIWKAQQSALHSRLSQAEKATKYLRGAQRLISDLSSADLVQLGNPSMTAENSQAKSLLSGIVSFLKSAAAEDLDPEQLDLYNSIRRDVDVISSAMSPSGPFETKKKGVLPYSTSGKFFSGNAIDNALTLWDILGYKKGEPTGARGGSVTPYVGVNSDKGTLGTFAFRNPASEVPLSSLPNFFTSFFNSQFGKDFLSVFQNYYKLSKIILSGSPSSPNNSLHNFQYNYLDAYFPKEDFYDNLVKSQAVDLNGLDYSSFLSQLSNFIMSHPELVGLGDDTADNLLWRNR